MLLGRGKYATGNPENDLQIVKDILRNKFLVGLITQMEESFKRFDSYFAFDDGSGNAQMCSENILASGHGKNRHNHPKVEPGTDDWDALASINDYDIQIYEYVEQLFEEQ